MLRWPQWRYPQQVGKMAYSVRHRMLTMTVNLIRISESFDHTFSFSLHALFVTPLLLAHFNMILKNFLSSPHFIHTADISTSLRYGVAAHPSSMSSIKVGLKSINDKLLSHGRAVGLITCQLTVVPLRIIQFIFIASPLMLHVFA